MSKLVLDFPPDHVTLTLSRHGRFQPVPPKTKGGAGPVRWLVNRQPLRDALWRPDGPALPPSRPWTPVGSGRQPRCGWSRRVLHLKRQHTALLEVALALAAGAAALWRPATFALKVSSRWNVPSDLSVFRGPPRAPGQGDDRGKGRDDEFGLTTTLHTM